MQALTTIVVDDEPLARRRLSSLVQRDDRLTLLGEFEDGVQAIESIRRDRPKIVFLDVQMPELTGFDVLDAIVDIPLPAVVFVTAYDEFALKAFEIGAADYLLKPYAEERFDLAVARCVRALASRSAVADRERSARTTTAAYRATGAYLNRIAVPDGDRIFILEPREVDWLESADNYVKLHVGSRVYRLRDTLTNLISKLNPRDFLRVHRWYAVNLARIRAVEPWAHGECVLHLTTGASVRVSRTFAPRVRAMLYNEPAPDSPS